MKKTLLALIACGMASASQAATIQFDLIGTAGPGLLPGNEPSSTGTGSGGEISTGITFDTVSKKLTINVGWGTVNGFANLTGNVTAAHIHGPTTNPNGNNGVGDFRQTAGVLIGLDGAPFTFNSSASAGSITGESSALNATNEAALFAGKLYINLHTAANGGGEMRGFLVAVPEPGSALMGVIALGAFSLRRRRH